MNPTKTYKGSVRRVFLKNKNPIPGSYFFSGKSAAREDYSDFFRVLPGDATIYVSAQRFEIDLDARDGELPGTLEVRPHDFIFHYSVDDTPMTVTLTMEFGAAAPTPAPTPPPVKAQPVKATPVYTNVAPSMKDDDLEIARRAKREMEFPDFKVG